MAIENGRVSSEQERLPDHLERREVSDMTPGAVGFLDAQAFIITDDYLCWVNKKAEIIDQQEFGKEYIVVICFDEGMVVDLASNYNKPASFTRVSRGPIKNESQKMSSYAYDEGDLMPVVGIASTEGDLIKLDKAYKEMTGRHYLRKKARKIISSNKPDQCDISSKTTQTAAKGLLE